MSVSCFVIFQTGPAWIVSHHTHVILNKQQRGFKVSTQAAVMLRYVTSSLCFRKCDEQHGEEVRVKHELAKL